MEQRLDHGELAAMDVARRIPLLRERLVEESLDALLVTKLENVRYLTSFSGSAAMLLVSANDALFVTDGRYRDQSSEQLQRAGVAATIKVDRPTGQLEALQGFAFGTKRLGLEATSVTWGQLRRFGELFDAELVPSVGIIEALRTVKDEGELARIERACEIADVALAQVKSRLTEEVTEEEFAAELEFEMRRRGASGPSFETIVASGPNSAMPHARPTNRRILEGDLVTIDYGATVDGYRSDTTRTFSIGEPSTQHHELIDAVFFAQRAGLRALGDGVEAKEVDRACREALESVGLGEAFLHSTGHGVGLEIHEAPAIAPGSTDILRVGAAVTVEPGAYLASIGGVRIEDTVVITEGGHRSLSKSTKDYTL